MTFAFILISLAVISSYLQEWYLYIVGGVIAALFFAFVVYSVSPMLGIAFSAMASLWSPCSWLGCCG